jgi:hypothetical protein
LILFRHWHITLSDVLSPTVRSLASSTFVLEGGVGFVVVCRGITFAACVGARSVCPAVFGGWADVAAASAGVPATAPATAAASLASSAWRALGLKGEERGLHAFAGAWCCFAWWRWQSC